MGANLKNKQQNKLTREDRVAAALRENLGKRKQQLRTRDVKNEKLKNKDKE
jgi:hypothetical protein